MFRIIRGFFHDWIVIPVSPLSEFFSSALVALIAIGTMFFPLYAVGIQGTLLFALICILGIIACFVISFAIGTGAGCAWGGLIISFAVHKLSVTMGFHLLGTLGIAMIGILMLLPIALVSESEMAEGISGMISFAASIAPVLSGAWNTSAISGFEFCTAYNILHIGEFLSRPAYTGMFFPLMMFLLYLIAIAETIVGGIIKIIRMVRARKK